MATTIDMVSGDELTIPIFITDNKVPLDLTGCTVKLYLKNMSTNTRTNDTANNCAIVNAVMGEVSYTTASTDTPSGGGYTGDVGITFPSGMPRRIYQQVILSVRQAN